MNYTYVISQVGLLFLVLSMIKIGTSVLFFIAHGFAPEYEIDAHARDALAISGIGGLVIGAAIYRIAHRLLRRQEKQQRATAPLALLGPQLGRREAILLVAVSWLLGAALAAMPFYLWANMSADVSPDHPFASFTDCYFEASSGLTTTGATILIDIEAIPRSLLLWRALTHWLGGLGIVVLFVAVLPSLGVGAKRLFRLETPGPAPRGLRPHIRDTARMLMWIYSTITVIAIVSMRSTGAMGWFDAICNALSMVATGGLATRNASMGAFDSLAVDLVCLPFMVLAGVNFAIFYMLVQGRWRGVWKDTELRVYIALKIIVSIIVALNIWGSDIFTTAGLVYEQATLGEAFRFGTFQTIALHTGTGFVTADYDHWPVLSRTLLIGLMFVGGCAGSTAGGLKVVRLWITLKVLIAHVEHTFRPSVVRPLRISGGAVEPEIQLGAVVYTIALGTLFLLGTAALLLIEPNDLDFGTAATASLATLCNVGPGLYGVGATANYAWFTDGSKWVMSLLMVLGRLEVFTVLVLLGPRFWKST